MYDQGRASPDSGCAPVSLARTTQVRDRPSVGEAEPLYRRALVIHEQNYGPNHPDVPTTLNNLAQLLQDMNQPGDAEPLMRRALAIDEQSYGPDHPDVATVLNNLAQLLQATNRLGEAEPLIRRHLEIFLKFTRSTGYTHPHLKDAIDNYAGLLHAMGRSQEQILGALRELAPASFFPQHLIEEPP